MTIQADYVRTLFANLESGRTDAFFDHVAEDVNWTVMGTHPLAGTYHSKADFLAHTFTRLNNGKPFDNGYCWVARFSNGNIVEVRAYLDSALVKQLIDENERPSSTM